MSILNLLSLSFSFGDVGDERDELSLVIFYVNNYFLDKKIE